MDEDRKQDVEIFMEAIQLPPEDRASFLEAACGENIALRRRVEALLKSNERIGGFLEEPIIQSATEVRTQFTTAEKVGDQIGRYRLLQQIGEGGCGIVFLAEQREPVHRRVALKIIKPGMDTSTVVTTVEVVNCRGASKTGQVL